MRAMIFAAGLGTRLRPLTDDRPKALVRVAGDTLLGHTVRRLQAAGVDEFVINAHHFSQQIVDYLEASGNFGSNVRVSVEKDRPLETGGGIRHARPLLEGAGHFLVHNVDIISNLDIGKMVSSCRPDALATLLVSDRVTKRYLLFNSDLRLMGWTNVETGEVKSPFGDLNPDDCIKLAFGGVHYISDAVFPLMEGWPEYFSIIDFYLAAAAEHPIYGYVQEGLELIDVGKTAALGQAESYLTR